MFKLKPLARQSNIVIQEMDKELLIYDLKIGRVFNLNESSYLIWQLSDGQNDINEIANKISKKINLPVDEEFVWLALQELKKNNLLESKNEISNNFEGLNRREVIKKVGLTSLIALPFITSLMTPTAIKAASPTVNPNACRQLSSSCTGWGRSPGCVCLNASAAGNPGVAEPYPANAGNTAAQVGSGRSNCLAGYSCFSSAALGGGGNACCFSSTQLLPP